MGSEVDDIAWRSGCPISSGLDVLGDRWSLLVIRDLFVHGTRTYSEFRGSAEQIASNILASRLKLLTGLGLIERTDPEGPARNNAYQLTHKGEALQTVLGEFAKWSQVHLKEFNADLVDVI